MDGEMIRERVRVFEGNGIYFYHISDLEPFSIGGDNICRHHLIPDYFPGIKLTISKRDNCWFAEAEGEIKKKDKPFSGGKIDFGDIIILCGRERVVVQLVREEQSTVLQASLHHFDHLTIGRKSDNLLQFKNPMVSGHHALLEHANGVWLLQDLGSTNGTFLNGKNVQRAQIANNDRILIEPYEIVFSNGNFIVYGPPESAVLKEVKNVEEREKKSAILSPPVNQIPEFTRSPRILRERPSKAVEIEAAPELGIKPESGRRLTSLVPTAVSTLVMVIMSVSIGMSPTMLVFSVPTMLVGIVMSVLSYRDQNEKFQKRQNGRKEKYEQYLEAREKEIKNAVIQQRDAVLYCNPAPIDCVTMVEKLSRNLWERMPGDKDFLALRVGMGEEPLCIEVKTPKVSFRLEEDNFTYAPQKLAEKYRIVKEVPVLCDLRNIPSLGIIGSREQIARTAYCLVIQMCTHHSYDEVKLVALYSRQDRDRWDWMRWLPHAFGDGRNVRYMATSGYEANFFMEPLTDILKQRVDNQSRGGWGKSSAGIPHYIFLIANQELLQAQPIADYLLQDNSDIGISCIVLAESLSELPRNVMQILEARGNESLLYEREHAGDSRKFKLDDISLAMCEKTARKMLSIRLSEKSAAQLLPSSIGFLEGWHVRRPGELDIGNLWQNSCNYMNMSVPIGIRTNGENFYFDIHEKQHGPHGLVAGTTGSGKSEMVQSWILSMALQFSPQDVSFILIDFKGTGLILPFLELPHLAGTISDLDTNINRNLIALQSELQRRKALFDSVGVSNITSYLKLYQAGKATESLSYLFVIIDEYAEFKVKFPDFTDAVNSLFRTGRSMGVHIILLMQNPAGVVSGESEANVRFRWCLKVQSIAASKEILGGHDEAARITNPGRAYVRVGTDEVFEQIQSFYSGGIYQPDKMDEDVAETVVRKIEINGVRTGFTKQNDSGDRGTVREIDAVVKYLRDYTLAHNIPRSRQIWQNRMPAQILLPDILKLSGGHRDGELAPIVGMLDDPHSQRQYPFELPLSGNGHAVIYGAPGTGKTTFLQTLVLALCLQYSPDEVNVYIMDFGGWSMGMFKDFPHVGSIANDNEEEKIRKTVQFLSEVLDERKRKFAEQGVGNLKTYCQISGEKMPYLVLVLDNFAPVYQLYPQLEDFFIRLGREGGGFGVILVASTGSNMGLGYKLNQSIKTALALQMNDKSDYTSIVGRTSGLEPEPLPGRGLYRNEKVLEFQTALPSDSVDEVAKIKAIKGWGEELSALYGKQKAAGILVLPDVLPYSSFDYRDGIVLGLDFCNSRPVALRLDDPHYMCVSGLPGSGITTFFRMLIKQIQEKDKAQIAVFGDEKEYESVPGLKMLRNCIEADQYINELAYELTDRQELVKEEISNFEPIYIFVDGYKRLYQDISQKNYERLQAVVNIGAGLGVYLILADENNRMASLKVMEEKILKRMERGPAVLMGGSILQHQVVELDLDMVQKKEVLPKHAAYYVTSQNICKFLVMNEQ